MMTFFQSRKLGRRLLLCSLLVPALLLLATSASAQTAKAVQTPTTLVVSAPDSTPVGNVARIIAVLRDSAGKPVADARVLFTSPTSFAGTAGEMSVGEAWTDGNGIATLDYQMRSEGENEFISRFYGDGTHNAAEASTLVLAIGEDQLAERSAGVKLPLGSWTIILVLGSVWTVYFLGMLQALRIPEEPASQMWTMGGRP